MQMNVAATGPNASSVASRLFVRTALPTTIFHQLPKTVLQDPVHFPTDPCKENASVHDLKSKVRSAHQRTGVKSVKSIAGTKVCNREKCDMLCYQR